MTLKRPIQLTFLLFMLTFLTSSAQDIHYSQFYNAPFNLSPALAGIFSGEVRVTANYRNQWSVIPASYETATVAADLKIRNKTYGAGFFATGLVINWDQVALTNLSHLNALIPISYTLRLTDRFFGSAGFGVSFHQRRFSLNGISFDSQYTDGGFDAGNPNLEPLDGNKNEYIDLSFGLNFRLQSITPREIVYPQEKRSKLDFGVGVFNLTKPNQSFLPDGDDPLPIRIAPYAIGTMMLDPKVDIVGRFGAQIQDKYLEALGGLGIKYHLNLAPGKECAVTLGANIRFQDFGDAYYPLVEVAYKNWEVGFSYDVNISRLNIATNGNSGPEFSVRYFIKNLPKLKPDDCRLL